MKKIYGVIGDPIEHSMSPVMHNDLFQHYGMDAVYHAFHIKKENLLDAVKGFKAINLAGFNITVPHKTAIMPFLDEMDDLAVAIGAANTVVNKDGRLIGYNTDGSGFLEGVKKEIPSFKDKKMLLIGAGGAARAIYFTMAFEGIKKIDITNRTPEKGEYLVKNCPYPVSSDVLTLMDAEKNLAAYDIIVQTTSIGMYPNTGNAPLSLEGINRDAFVCDIIYTPLETKLLKDAKQKGVKTQNGVQMFIYQGALAFEKWTGVFPNIDRMYHTVMKQLGGK